MIVIKVCGISLFDDKEKFYEICVPKAHCIGEKDLYLSLCKDNAILFM